jgi:hypothetical protein
MKVFFLKLQSLEFKLLPALLSASFSSVAANVFARKPLKFLLQEGAASIVIKMNVYFFRKVM